MAGAGGAAGVAWSVGSGSVGSLALVCDGSGPACLRLRVDPWVLLCRDIRYEVDFLPALVLLAVVGILGLERALAPTSKSGLANRPVWRRAGALGLGPAAGLLGGV